jgi:hypothetical protein
MKKIFFLVAAYLFVYSCTPVSIVDNKRLQVTGTIVNSEGQALEGFDVETRTYVGTGFFLGSPDLKKINGTTTNADGKFSFTSLDVDSDELIVQINSNSDSLQDNFQSLTFLDNRSGREETLLDLGTIVLKRRVNITVVFNIEEPFGVQLLYPNPYPVITINNWNELEELPEELEYSRFRDMYTLVKADDDGLYRLRLETLENSEIILTYGVDGITTESTILISGEEESPYEFTP